MILTYSGSHQKTAVRVNTLYDAGVRILILFSRNCNGLIYLPEDLVFQGVSMSSVPVLSTVDTKTSEDKNTSKFTKKGLLVW